MNMLYRKYRHIQTGAVYTLLMFTNENAVRHDFVKTAVYMDIKGNVWSRPYDEFMDRFEPIDHSDLTLLAG